MEKTITVGEKEVRLKTNAGLVRRYREWFKRDLTSDMQYVMNAIVENTQDGVAAYSSLPVEVLAIFEDMAYAMNRYGDPENVPDNIDEWLDQFETFDIYTIFPELITLWGDDSEVSSRHKKK